MVAIREKHGIVLLYCLRLQRQGRSWRSASRRDSPQGLTLRTKQDYPFAVPTATRRISRIANRLSRAAIYIDLFELPIGKKSNVAVVGRPERQITPIGARQVFQLD